MTQSFNIVVDEGNVSDLFFNHDLDNYRSLIEARNDDTTENEMNEALREDARNFLCCLAGSPENFSAETGIEDPISMLVQDFYDRV